MSRPTIIQTGIRCKCCGCNDAAPCLVDGRPCSWLIVAGESVMTVTPGIELGPSPGGLADVTDNLCSNPDCMAKAYREAVRDIEAEAQEEAASET